MKETPAAFPLPSGALAIMKRIGEAGGRCVVVGGAVRDVLRGEKPEDVDLASSLPPEKVVSLFSDCRLILDGEKHGTVGILWDGEIFEVTSFRRDGDYPDRRHPAEVTFTGSLEEDLRRRDFTVNAMAWSPETGLVDPFGGKRDLEEGLLRAVGDPGKRFGEDSLRILRLLRFLSTLGFRAEEETGRAARRLAPALETVSGERIARELEKLLAGPAAARVLREYREIASLLLGEYQTPRALT
ncbi:MAG: CCA tRNA nucleotidyltransferase, partial [Clostridia bacterium]|nr:CCA tRNA nucleotidyltransferase [Clostridia bacterium]